MIDEIVFLLFEILKIEITATAYLTKNQNFLFSTSLKLVILPIMHLSYTIGKYFLILYFLYISILLVNSHGSLRFFCDQIQNIFYVFFTI